jgi:hypothetical protein
MEMQMTEQEIDLLLELIEGAEKTAIQGIDHADSRAFKEQLRGRMRLLESLKEKVQRSPKLRDAG